MLPNAGPGRTASVRRRTKEGALSTADAKKLRQKNNTLESEMKKLTKLLDEVKEERENTVSEVCLDSGAAEREACRGNAFVVFRPPCHLRENQPSSQAALPV